MEFGGFDVITRDELYELVWAEPMTKVSERLGVSGSYLARVCSTLNVPRPERGHWAKLAVGKARPKRPLPEARPGDPLSWSKEGELRAPRRPRPAAPVIQAERKVKISRSHTHRLVREAKLHFEQGRSVEEGAYLKPYKRLLVDVNASQTGLERALELANDIFNALESLGHRVVIAPADEQLRRPTIDEREVPTTQRNYYYSSVWSPQRPTVVYVGAVAIGLAIVEMSGDVLLRYVRGKYIREADHVPPRNYRSRYDHSWTTTRELPVGRFRIIAYCPYGSVAWQMGWQDGPKSSVSSSVRTVVRAIESAAPELVTKLEAAEREAELRRIEWLAAEERRCRKEDRRRISQSVEQSHTQLAEVIQQWSKVLRVEQFLADVEERAQRLPDAERIAINERLKLARSFLGTQEPLDFFRLWKTPQELYSPKYTADD